MSAPSGVDLFLVAAQFQSHQASNTTSGTFQPGWFSYSKYSGSLLIRIVSKRLSSLASDHPTNIDRR